MLTKGTKTCITHAGVMKFAEKSLLLLQAGLFHGHAVARKAGLHNCSK